MEGKDEPGNTALSGDKAESLDGKPPTALQEEELWASGLAADLQPPMPQKLVILFLIWMTSKSCGSKELPTKRKGATGMGKALAASRRHTRGLHPDLGGACHPW